MQFTDLSKIYLLIAFYSYYILSVQYYIDSDPQVTSNLYIFKSHKSYISAKFNSVNIKVSRFAEFV